MPERTFKNPFTGRVRRTYKNKRKKIKRVEVYKPNPDPYSMSDKIYIKDKYKEKKTALGFDKKSEKIKNVDLNARSFKDTSDLPTSNQKRVVFSGGKRRGDADDFGSKKSKIQKATNPFLDAPVPTEKEIKTKKPRIAKRGGIIMGESRFRNQYD
tara:strand:- start:139 stop:603 length:465 start_codon:yes stop_codon:yes gene_type:complete